ncbi:Clp protease N-terminal domain-containing protein [Plantactinospora siamensis]|uniref:Clp protease N-terminal domain-containing protein n=1 Tax=Plantactinospora siamensis TaxID=555372 RepID=A0ABV6NPR2_9ACTN
MFERFTQPARTTVVEAQAAARRLRHRRIGTEHLLLALLRQHDGTAEALHDAGVTADGVEAAIVRLHDDAPGTLGETDAAALRTIGIDLAAIRDRLEHTFGPDALEPPTDEPSRRFSGTAGRARRWLGARRGRASGSVEPGWRLPFAPRAKKVLELSLREALRLGHRHIGTEHILLGLLRENGGLAARILADAGVDFTALRQRTEATLRTPAG